MDRTNNTGITLSFIVPTIGRPTLPRTLKSIDTQEWLEGDCVYVVDDGGKPGLVESLIEGFTIPIHLLNAYGPHNDWGNIARNLALKAVTTSHVMFIDDDDWYVDGAIKCVRETIGAASTVPHLFRFKSRQGEIIWRARDLVACNVGTPNLVCESKLAKKHFWDIRFGYISDFNYIEKVIKECEGSVVWADSVICECG